MKGIWRLASLSHTVTSGSGPQVVTGLGMVTASQLVQEDSALGSHDATADRCRLAGTPKQPLLNLTHHLWWGALRSQHLAYSTHAQFDNPIALLPIPAHLERRTAEGARIGVDRPQTISLHWSPLWFGCLGVGTQVRSA